MLSPTLLIAILMLADPAYPAGMEVHQSECASGGFDYFFFANGAVIAKCWGCETNPHVRKGTWKREGPNVRIRMTQEWFGRGRGRIVEVASVDVFEDYVAEMRTGSVKAGQELFHADDFATQDGCEYAARHERTPDPHAFLRLFDGDHPDTYRKVLSAADLQGRSGEQLRLMRNEVFARYGYRFKDPALLAFFGKRKEYRPELSNVDAFLSDIERENVARLHAAEKATSAAPATVGK